jgi:spore germination cell wall hydrolase CwlJ-like protein
MVTRTLILERLREDLYIRSYVNEMLNEVFTGYKTGKDEYEWDINNKRNIKDIATEYFNKIKNKYNSLAPETKNKLRTMAIASVISLVTVNIGANKEQLSTTNKSNIKQDIEQIADKILPKEDKKDKPVKSNKLSYDEYIIATTLVGEAGGEGKIGMIAVANVLKNRAKATKENIANIALKPKQFSMWNSHTINGSTVQDVHKKYVKDAYPNNGDIWDSAIEIVKNINNLNDNTGGATSYYNSSIVKPKWGEGSDTWKNSKKIGNHVFGIDTSINWGKKWFNNLFNKSS